TGAASVTASDVDPLAGAAIQLNAAANGVGVSIVLADLLDGDGDGAAVVLARGAEVLIGDLGRTYLPRQRLEAVATYDVPCIPGLEDVDVKRTSVWRL